MSYWTLRIILPDVGSLPRREPDPDMPNNNCQANSCSLTNWCCQGPSGIAAFCRASRQLVNQLAGDRMLKADWRAGTPHKAHAHTETSTRAKLPSTVLLLVGCWWLEMGQASCACIVGTSTVGSQAPDEKLQL